jgi:CHAD domain-containing protein
VAEIGAETSKQAAALAARFEGVQQILGTWHDHLLLLAKAHEKLEKDNPLIKKIEADTQRLRQRASSTARKMLARI